MIREMVFVSYEANAQVSVLNFDEVDVKEK